QSRSHAGLRLGRLVAAERAILPAGQGYRRRRALVVHQLDGRAQRLPSAARRRRLPRRGRRPGRAAPAPPPPGPRMRRRPGTGRDRRRRCAGARAPFVPGRTEADVKRFLIEDDDEAIAALLRSTRRVAVLGIKTEAQAGQPAFYVPKFLADIGLDVVPVP